MKARVQVIRKNKKVSDQIWKRKRDFSNMSVHGHMADKIRLDVELDSVADVMALFNWCEIFLSMF